MLHILSSSALFKIGEGPIFLSMDDLPSTSYFKVILGTPNFRAAVLTGVLCNLTSSTTALLLSIISERALDRRHLQLGN